MGWIHAGQKVDKVTEVIVNGGEIDDERQMGDVGKGESRVKVMRARVVFDV